MKTTPSPYSVRLPEKFRTQLKYFSKNGNRSLHAEILLRLEKSLLTEKHQMVTRGEVEEIARNIVVQQFRKLNK